jgi:formate C-acetyltransferase
VLWSKNLPEAFKRYCIATSIATSALQYENDDLMTPEFGDDYGIACCVSAMRIGKQMQYFGARVNLAKALLYAINGGRDEKSGVQVAPAFRPAAGDVLDYDDVMAKFDDMMEWLAQTYVHAMNCIHYAHDHYNYERLMMALHDRDIVRTMAFGIAGLSVAADSLSAIKYAKVKPIRREDGLVIDYERTGEFPPFGNNDPRVDDIAVDLVKRFMDKLRKHPAYRGAVHTQSVLTITSNVVYGKGTGNTPDGRATASPSRRAQTRCTAAIRTAGSRRACPSRGCLTRKRRTASATRSPSSRPTTGRANLRPSGAASPASTCSSARADSM